MSQDYQFFSSSQKLKQASFFIELLEAVEQRGVSLTLDSSVKEEVSFLFAAALNSFYSVVAIMEETEGISTKKFKDIHPEIYARDKSGGERAKTVHISHTTVAHVGYIPPRGNEVDLRMRPRPKLLLEQDAIEEGIVLKFNDDHYMHVRLRGELVHAVKFCLDHLAELLRFHNESTGASTCTGNV